MRKLAILPVLLVAACATQPPNLAGTLSGKTGLHVADVAMANGIPQTTLQIAHSMLEKDPGNVEAMLRLGEAQYSMGQRMPAADTFRRALALQPRSARARLGLARIELATNPATAEATLRAGLAAEPTNASLLTDLGVAQDLQGRHAEAQASYRSALGARPDLASAQVDLGLSLALSGQAHDAVRMLEPFGADPSSTPRVREDLATALALSGNTAAASTMLEADMSRDQAVMALSGLSALHDAGP